MKHLSPSLLALVALAPTVAALEVSDADVKLGLVLQLQVRAERGWSRGADGNAYNVAESATNSAPDTADAYLKRFRVGFAGSYKDDYRFRAVMRFDGADRTGDTAPTATAGTGAAVATSGDPLNRVAQINQAYVERIIKGDNGLDHSIRAGLDYPFFNGTAAVFPAATYLFPTDRATSNAALLAPRGVGAGYKLSGQCGGKPFTWGVDVQNNIADDSATATGNTGGTSYNQKGEGLCYTTRLQGVVYDSEAKGHMKPVESFVGAPGTGVFASVEAGVNRNNNASPTTRQNLKAAGVEVLVHKDALTALAEYRVSVLNIDAAAAANDRSNRSAVFLIQAGYAIQHNDTWIEPAFRWSWISFEHDLAAPQSYGSQSGSGMDYGSSGLQTELGVNWYLNKYSNKVSFAYQNWRGKGDTTNNPSENAANANILRAQWGLFF